MNEATVMRVNLDDDIRARDGLLLPAAALEWSFDRAGGPGGQHRNKANTRATARVNLELLDGPPEVVERVKIRLGAVIVLSEGASRSQWRNRARVVERVTTAIEEAARPDRRRRPTRPTRSAVEQRLADKRRTAARKRERRHDTGAEQ